MKHKITQYTLCNSMIAKPENMSKKHVFYELKKSKNKNVNKWNLKTNGQIKEQVRHCSINSDPGQKSEVII
jgi:hypothetical protein